MFKILNADYHQVESTKMSKTTRFSIRPRGTGRWLKGLVAVLLAVPLNAATITTIQAPPSNEASTVAVVEAFCPTCERVSDNDDILFSSADGFWVFAFEDMHGEQSDRDFNDLIVWALFDSGTILEWDEVASHSAAISSFGFDGLHVFALPSGVPGVSASWSDQSYNLDGLDHVVSWLRPDLQPLPSDTAQVPEPASWIMLATGLGLALRFLSRSA